MVNLINLISEEEKEKMNAYINKFGINKEDFIGLDYFLRNWAYSKQTLFKLLGGRLIYECPIKYEKTEQEINNEIDILVTSHSFFVDFFAFINAHDRELLNDLEESVINKIALLYYKRIEIFESNEIGKTIAFKCKKPNEKKVLQITEKMKPIRAFQKFLIYFGADKKLIDSFEDFRIKLSMITNAANIESTLCISIHPFDFITMSDNDSNWISCMNWHKKGCYRLGTIEMMNSNNVVCCYIKNKKDYIFDKEENSWNNKRWRNLFYVTKDIIVAGKGYPYRIENIDLIILNIIKDLAKKNCNWTYSFGPELYQDMKHVNTDYFFAEMRRFIRLNQTKKHNILFDTNIMYNDFVADHKTKHICYRNKVNRNKVISVSGKVECLCCGDTLIESNYEPEDYHDRFANTDSVVCDNCKEKFRCGSCGSITPEGEFYKVREIKKYKKVEVRYCKYCVEDLINICPCCGKNYITDTSTNKNFLGYFAIKDSLNVPVYCYDFLTKENREYDNLMKYINNPESISDLAEAPQAAPLSCCPECINKVREELNMTEYTFRTTGFGEKTAFVTFDVDLAKKYSALISIDTNNIDKDEVIEVIYQNF